MLRRLDTRRAWTGLATVLLGVSALTADSSGPSPASERSGYLELSGSKLYYEECGSGPPIVLLHDGLLHSVSWDEVWQPLAKKYRVIRYDRRGYGQSDPATSSFSPMEDLTKLLRHLTIEQAFILGRSSGAAQA